MSRGRVTRVVVTQLEPDAAHPDPWRVTWTTGEGRRADELAQDHDSKAAAQRLVANLLTELAPGVTRDDALTVCRLNDENARPA